MRRRIVPTLCRIARAWHLLPWRTFAAATAVMAVGWLTSLTSFTRPAAAPLATAALLVGLGCVGWWALRHVGTPLSPKEWVARADREADRTKWVAGPLDVIEHAGVGAMRARARVVRPSLARLSHRELATLDPREYAVPLLVTSEIRFGNTIWLSREECSFCFGGPRKGKSGALAVHCLDAPGALLVTSSRTDLLNHTEDARRLKGRVDVFNPTRIGDVPSTVRWSVIAGCEDFGTATRRAGDLIPSGKDGEGERWDAQARGLLAILLHAAALSGGSLRTVLRWISPADAVAMKQVLAALENSPSPALKAEVRSVYTTNERTLSSITSTMLPGIRWASDSTIAEVGDADLNDPAFLDVRRLIEDARDSLYLVGREGGARSLTGALTAEFAHWVRMIAGGMPGGRLDPPATAVLDEVPLTCGAIPIDDWTSDMGGRGLTIHLGAQSPAQLRAIWGNNKTAAIMNNMAGIIVFGGLKDDEDLKWVSTLADNRLFDVDSDDRRREPLLSPGRISQFQPGTAVIFRDGIRPAIGKPPSIWDSHNKSRIKEAKRMNAEALNVAPSAPALTRGGDVVGEVVDIADVTIEAPAGARAHGLAFPALALTALHDLVAWPVIHPIETGGALLVVLTGASLHRWWDYRQEGRSLAVAHEAARAANVARSARQEATR